MELQGTQGGTRLAEVLLSQLVVGWELGEGCRAGGVGVPGSQETSAGALHRVCARVPGPHHRSHIDGF